MVKEVPRSTINCVEKGYQYNSLKTVIYSDGAYKGSIGVLQLTDQYPKIAVDAPNSSLTWCQKSGENVFIHSFFLCFFDTYEIRGKMIIYR